MKTILLTLFIIAGGDIRYENVPVRNATVKVYVQEFDVAKLTQEISVKLATALSLAKEQQPKVTSAVSSYLVEKSKIIKADKATYVQKQQLLFNGFKSKISGVLLQNQMAAFNALKPAATDIDNILTQLFY